MKLPALGPALALTVLMLSLPAAAAPADGGAPEATKAMAKAAAPDEFVVRLFGGPVSQNKKTYACFTRSYDPEHLAAHPQQKVNAMKLLLTAEKVPEDPEMNYSFRLGVKYRHRTGNFDSSGDCGHGKIEEEGTNQAMLGCGVDCDGGGINVLLARDDKAVIVKLERIRIWKDNNYDEDAEYSLVGGADDKVFRLDRASLKDCESLVTDRKELAAMRRK
jgi:hypothetical protein